MTTLYRFYSTFSNKELSKAYTLSGIKTALGNPHSWTKGIQNNLEIVEYEKKDSKRLTVNEFRNLNNQDDKLLYLIKTVGNSKNLTIEFISCNTGYLFIVGKSEEDRKRFNSLDEAINIVNQIVLRENEIK